MSRKEIYEGVIELWEHRYRYYEKDYAVISDYQYDMLEKKIDSEAEGQGGWLQSILPSNYVGYNLKAHTLAVERYNDIFDEEKQVIK